MSRFAIHELGSPQIIRVVSCHPSMLQWQMTGTQVSMAVDDGITDESHYIADGVLTPKPSKPSEDHVWDWDSLSWRSPALEILKSRQWNAIKESRSVADEAPIELDGIVLNADGQAVQNIMGSIQAMQLRGASTKNWRCYDNVMRELTLNQLIAYGLAIESRRQQLIEKSDLLWQQLQEANTQEEVEAIVWTN